jgi:exopolyphosphatase/guanosine-5'-triphosphate,3'-diphosphate pyrophosphatase
MRFAIIDLGTNSVRFDVHQVGPGQKLRALHREKVMVRLGQGAFVSGKLDPAAISRTLFAFERFRSILDRLKVTRVRAFGTSALREVKDRDEFLKAIRDKTGIEVRVISGSDEARLIALGVLENERASGPGKYALIDIGGGSTEVCICSGKKVLHAVSLELGTARLQQLFLKRSPPDPRSVDMLRAHIRSTVYSVFVAQRWPTVPLIVGSSGTVKTLSKILTTESTLKAFSRKSLSLLVGRMTEMNTSELLDVHGMDPKRVDMIVAGSLLLEECALALKARDIRATEYSLRDGIVLEELKVIKKGAKSRLSVHLDDVLKRATHFGMDEDYLNACLLLSGDVWDKLKRVHGLREDFKPVLGAATLLRDIGENVAYSKHEEHSAYLVKHADLPPMDEIEQDLIAMLVLHHEGDKSQLKGLPPSWDSRTRVVFNKLLALLRVIDALDSGGGARVRIKQVRAAGRSVKLGLRGTNLSGLEKVTLENRRTLFKETFGKTIEVI